MTLETLLKQQPKARERKNKCRAIAFLPQEECKPLKDLSLDRVEELVKMVNSLDREWRKLLEENISLRGTDYETTKQLTVDKKLKELGYEKN
jgi:polysaccharide pyruvyl transferase WcaK-like protein